jgi:hypothetical protein
MFIGKFTFDQANAVGTHVTERCRAMCYVDTMIRQLAAHGGLSGISQNMTVSFQKLPFGLRWRKVGCTGLGNIFLAHAKSSGHLNRRVRGLGPLNYCLRQPTGLEWNQRKSQECIVKFGGISECITTHCSWTKPGTIKLTSSSHAIKTGIQNGYVLADISFARIKRAILSAVETRF